MKKKEFIDFLERFSTTNFKGRNIKKCAQIDGIPLWWFVRLSFLNGHCPFKSMQFGYMAKLYDKKKSFSFINFKKKLIVFLFNKLFLFNEFFRWIVSIASKEYFNKDSNKRILFLAHTNGLIRGEKNCWGVDRVDDVRQLIDSSNELSSYLSVVEPPSRNSFFSLRKYPNLLYKNITMNLLFKSFFKSLCLRRKVKSFLKTVSFKTEEEQKMFFLLKPSFSFFLSFEKIFLTVLYYLLYRELIQKRDISFVFLYSTGDLFARCAMAAADKEGIFAGSILHGLGSFSLRPEVPDKFVFFVSGEFYKNNLVSLDCKPEQIHITGAVFMSQISRFKPDLRRHNRVLFLTSPLIEYNIRSKEDTISLMKEIFLIFKDYPKTKFVLKPHPNERFIHIYHNLKKELSVSNLEIVSGKSKDNLYNWINKSDFLLSFGSTASFEALLLKKPSIIFDFFGDHFEGSFDTIMDSGFFIKTDKINTLRTYLKEALSNNSFFNQMMSKRKDFIESQVKFNDDKIPQRVFEIVRELSLNKVYK